MTIEQAKTLVANSTLVDLGGYTYKKRESDGKVVSYEFGFFKHNTTDKVYMVEYVDGEETGYVQEVTKVNTAKHFKANKNTWQMVSK